MRVVVLGAGVIGIATAYELARDGHDVTVVDRHPEAARETSFANGGQLSAHHGEPLAGPGALPQALRWLGRKDAPLTYRLRLDPALWSWTLDFLAQCPEPRFWDNTAKMLRVALYSRERLHETLDRETVAFDHLNHGIITLYQDARAFDRALDEIRAMKELGSERQALDRKGCFELEPALAHASTYFAGGVLTPGDESGDCRAFTLHLARRCAEMGVTFKYDTTVTGLERDGWRVARARTHGEAIEGDAFVLALGSYSAPMLKTLDLRLPVYPAKGYSVTIPVTNDEMAPKVSITSLEHRLVFSRLGNHLRAAGLLEFNGFDTRIDDRRARVALRGALQVFPDAGNADGAEFWTGLRPLTPDGVPVIGRARQENLILNTGHGMLGWTMAMGSARISADLVAGHAPSINMDGLGWERFA
ncbi:MAG: D-amino acid dehydrogenase [Alphaproteobacteria bacterium]|nr:D-amino acid dehydrogenase [Alphaproteobacteria bacterium]